MILLLGIRHCNSLCEGVEEVKKAIIFSTVAIALFLFTMIPLPKVYASDIHYITLDGDYPMGIVYDVSRNCVWVAVFMSNKLAKIDVITGDVTYYITECYKLALDENNNLWITVGQANRYKEFFPDNETFVTYYQEEQIYCADVAYLNGKMWFVGGRYLSEVNPADGSVLSTIDILGYWGHDACIIPDGDSLWMTFFDGRLSRFNTTTREIDANITSLSRPWGIVVEDQYVYVAENNYFLGNEMGTIAKIDKSTLEIVDRIPTIMNTNPNPSNIYEDSMGYMWYMYGGVIGIVGSSVQYYVAYVCYCMTEVSYTMKSMLMGSDIEVKEVWFSAKGSAHVGEKDILTLGRCDFNLDGKIDINDLARVESAFGTYESQPVWKEPVWNATYDVNLDYKVDITDIAMVSSRYGQIL